MNPFSADPRSANFTFFYKSLHCADRTAQFETAEAQSTTVTAKSVVFVALPARETAIRTRR